MFLHYKTEPVHFRSLRSPKLHFPTFDSDMMADHHVMRQRDKNGGPNSPTKEGDPEKLNGINSGATTEGEIQNSVTAMNEFSLLRRLFIIRIVRGR